MTRAPYETPKMEVVPTEPTVDPGKARAALPPEFVAIVDAAMRWRGAIITRYASVEFFLTELILRAWRHPIYVELGEVPYSYSGKMKRLGKILEMEGPVKPYAPVQ